MNSPGAVLITAIVMPSKQQTELGGLVFYYIAQGLQRRRRNEKRVNREYKKKRSCE